MYNPIKYKSMEELIGTIEVDRVALTDGQGLYLQFGETWDADLSQGNAQTWSATKDTAAINLKIAELDEKGDVADMEPLFVWADKTVAKVRFGGDVNAFADYLVRDGLAEVYNYTPAEQVAVVSEEDELEEQDEE